MSTSVPANASARLAYGSAAVTVDDLLRPLGVRVHHRDQLESVGQLGEHLAVVAADDAGADERHATTVALLRAAHAYAIPSLRRMSVKAVCAWIHRSAPEKPPREFCVAEVRFEGEEAVEAVLAQGADGLGHLTVARPGHHHRGVGEEGVLDLDVDGVRPQVGVALAERLHPALDVVGRIPSQLEIRRVDRRDDVQAAARDVAEDLLLVLVHGDHSGLLGDVGDRPHPGDHLVPVVVRIVALGDEEGEEPEVRRLQQPGDLGGVPHPLQVRPEVVGDLDLADRRADAGDLQTVLGEESAALWRAGRRRGRGCWSPTRS